MDLTPKREDAVKKITELINHVRVCMFTVIDESGHISSRPMITVDVDRDGNAWFFTNEHTGKEGQISENNEVGLIYAHPGSNIYMNIFGIGTLVADREKMKQLWTPALKEWFPRELEDPDLRLLKVDTKQAWYWDNSSSRMVVGFNVLTAIVKGKE